MKYKFTDETMVFKGVTLRRIYVDGLQGGWIEKESNLTENAMILDEAKVYGNAVISGDARIADSARVHGNAQVSGNVTVSGRAEVFDNACVSGNAHIIEDAKVFDDAHVTDYSCIYEMARVYGKSKVFEEARVFGNALVYGASKVSGNSKVSDWARVFGNSRITGYSVVNGEADIYGKMKVHDEEVSKQQTTEIVLIQKENQMKAKLIFPMIKPMAQIMFSEGTLFIREGDIAGPYSDIPLYKHAFFVSADCIKWYRTDLKIHEIAELSEKYTYMTQAMNELTQECESFEPDFY